MNWIQVSWYNIQLWPLLNVAMSETLEIKTETVSTFEGRVCFS